MKVDLPGANLPTDAHREKGARVQAMFTRVAPRYDLMNRLMTGGQDQSWRRQVIRLAQIPAGGRVLDLGAGTGDLSRETARQSPEAHVFPSDFTLEMMRTGAKLPGAALPWSCADALDLPFLSESFDAVVSGFLLRNVADLPRALREQFRVLKPGGRVVALDTTQPRPSPLEPFIRFYMRRVIPFLGGLLTGERDAYVYLPTSSEQFLLAEDLLECFRAAGFTQASFRRLMFGTIAIHWGVKVV